MKTDYHPLVFDSPTIDFPFVAELPKREKTRLGKLWDGLRDIAALQKQHGFTVPQKAAAMLLDVSASRVDQLVEAGKLTRVDFCGHVYITENSLIELARSERKNGRPLKTLEEAGSSPLKAWKVARHWLKENPVK